MGTVKNFEDLNCWQDARSFVGLVYGLTKNDGFRIDFGLVTQVRGSAISSMANIAEGFHRNSTKDFMRFLGYSRASAAETVSHCYVALDQKYINESEMAMVRQQAEIVMKKINSFITYLNSLVKDKTNKTNKTNVTNPTNKTNQTNPTNVTNQTNSTNPTNVTNQTNSTNKTSKTNSTNKTNQTNKQI
jgi:four helix bundle protein